jgi:hypothetical protein
MYNKWLSGVAFAYKRLPGELLDIPWSHFLIMALPLKEHECDQAFWSAVAAHDPARLSKIRDEIGGVSGEPDDDEYEENFRKLKALASKGGVLLDGSSPGIR